MTYKTATLSQQPTTTRIRCRLRTEARRRAHRARVEAVPATATAPTPQAARTTTRLPGQVANHSAKATNAAMLPSMHAPSPPHGPVNQTPASKRYGNPAMSTTVTSGATTTVAIGAHGVMLANITAVIGMTASVAAIPTARPSSPPRATPSTTRQLAG